MDKTIRFVTTLLTASILVLLAVGPATGQGPGQYAPDEVVCRMEPGYSIDSVNNQFGTTIKRYM